MHDRSLHAYVEAEEAERVAREADEAEARGIEREVPMGTQDLSV